MSHMFDNYPQPDDYIPTNIPKHFKKPSLDIMAGETSIHSFEVPLNVEELLNYKVIYQLGADAIIIKDKYSLEYTILENN